MRTRLPLTLAATVLLAVACGGEPTQGPDAAAPPPPQEDDGGGDPQLPADPEDARARAEALLGQPESEVEEGPGVRIARRGGVSHDLTMDLQPGRLNVELDDVDGSGTYRVTVVVIETLDGSEVLRADD